MTPRSWENIAKYLFDISKIVVALAVIGPLVTQTEPIITRLAFGCVTAIIFLKAALIADKKGDIK